MQHRRCTRCKQEVGQYGVRHKWMGGVYCEQCIKIARGFGSGRRNWFGRAFNWVSRIVKRVLHVKTPAQKKAIKTEEKASYKRMKDTQMKARSIPHDPTKDAPQKK